MKAPAPTGSKASQVQPPQITLAGDYREGYANSVQLRLSLWDFFLQFGTLSQDQSSVASFQGVFLSPQQAKALTHLLTQHVQQYERTFGEIRLAPVDAAAVQS